MKTFSKCLALILAVAGAATLAGCNNGSSSRKTATTANWNVRTSVSAEENSFDLWKNHKEVAEYAVAFTKGSNNSYEVKYDTETATYGTEFYMIDYDWATDTAEEYRTEESVSESVYVYKTSLKISGSYKLKSGEAEFAFDDELTTVSYFRTAKDNLQPVYSYQKVKNTAPAALSTGSLSSSYVQTNEIFETFYNKSCTEALVLKSKPESDGSETYAQYATKKIRVASEYSTFDNSQLRAAIRAFTLSGGVRSFNVLSPQNDGVQSVSATIAGATELNPLDADHAVILNALNAANESGYLFFDGAIPDKAEGESDRNFRYNAVSLSVNQSLAGTSPYMWYSTVENSDINATRCVLLRVGTPLSFGMGTLSYTLKSLSLENITRE